MDDDLLETQSLTSDQVGSVPDGLLEKEGLGAGPDPQSNDQSWSTRIKRGANIAASGEHRGVRYHWRDRLTIFGRAAVVGIGLLALVSLLLDVVGFNSGPVDQAEVATREAILAGYAHAAEIGMTLLNNPLITLAVAAAAGVFLWREEM